jgi:hypothetical protein
MLDYALTHAFLALLVSRGGTGRSHLHGKSLPFLARSASVQPQTIEHGSERCIYRSHRYRSGK